MYYRVIGQSESVRNLAEALNGDYGVPPRTKRQRIRLRRMYDVIVNYGWTTRLKCNLNSNLKGIKSKAFASILISEAGVPTTLYNDMWGKLEFPCLQRKAYHSRGRDIRVIGDRESMAEYDSRGRRNYYVNIFDKTREFRVHVCLGEVIKVQQKVPKDANVQRSIVWNRENSTFMRRDMSNPLYDNICQLSIKAVEALGLDFGAVDVGVRKLGKRAEEVVVFEVNTAPCMNRDTAGRYARRIKDYYERRER